MTPKHFSDRFRFYTIYLRKITQKNFEKKKRIVRSLLSTGMQEHVAEHREKSRNTCTKKYTICIIQSKKEDIQSTPKTIFFNFYFPIGGSAGFFPKKCRQSVRLLLGSSHQSMRGAEISCLSNYSLKQLNKLYYCIDRGLRTTGV